MTTPTTSKYILSEADSQLPNSTVLEADNGLVLAELTGITSIGLSNKLINMTGLDTEGLYVQTSTGEIETRELTASTGITIAQDFPLGMNPRIGALEESTIQKIYVTNNGIPRETPHPKINFIEGTNCTLTINSPEAGEAYLTIEANNQTDIESIVYETPAAYPSQVFTLNVDDSTPNEIVVTANVDVSSASNGDVLWTKIAPNPGVEWKAAPSGVKSFDMISNTPLIDISFDPDNHPSDPNDVLQVTLSATPSGTNQEVYTFNGTDVVFSTLPIAPIESIDFNFSTSAIFNFIPSSVNSTNQSSPVDFTFNETDIIDGGVIKGGLTGPGNTFEASYSTAVRSITFSIDANLSNIFTFLGTQIDETTNDVIFGFKTDSLVGGPYIPYWDGSTVNWELAFTAVSVNQVGLTIASNSTDLFQLAGSPSPITTSGTFEFGYNYQTSGASQTPPASTVRFNGADATWGFATNNSLTVVSAGQTTLSATGTPNATVYTGWNPSSGNLYFCKACGLSLNSGAAAAGNLTTTIIGANPTNVIVTSDNASDNGKTICYIVYFLTSNI